MRQANQRQFVAFRAGERLAGALHERAALAGVTVSEFLRVVVTEKVCVDERNGRETADA